MRTNQADILSITCAIPERAFLSRGCGMLQFSNPDDPPAARLQRRKELNMRAGGFGILAARNLVD